MYDRVIPRLIIVSVYIYFYALWLALIGGYVAYYFTENYLFDAYGLERYGWGKAIALSVIWFVVTAINIVTWLASILALRHAHARHRMELGDASRETLPGGVYIYPFGLFLTWIVVFPFIWAITYAIHSP